MQASCPRLCRSTPSSAYASWGDGGIIAVNISQLFIVRRISSDNALRRFEGSRALIQIQLTINNPPVNNVIRKAYSGGPSCSSKFMPLPQIHDMAAQISPATHPRLTPSRGNLPNASIRSCYAPSASSSTIGYNSHNLHGTIAKFSGNLAMIETVAKLRRTTRLFEQMEVPQPTLSPGTEEHLNIIEKMASGDPDDAAEAMRVHLEISCKGILDQI